MKIKMVVVGRGLAGCVTATYFKYFSPESDIELIYDSNIPALPIGQATVLDMPTLLWDVFRQGMNWYNNPIKATFKTGILYENWGKKNDTFFHPFRLGDTALHYSTDSVQDYLCKNGGFKVTDRTISDKELTEIDADYIFDCRGFPKNYDAYQMLINPINACLLAKNKEIKSTQHWTRAVATPNGWTFDIPLTDHTSLGYLYNSNITTDEEATQNFNEMFNNPEIYGKMKTKNYVVKEPIVDERIILNGCRLFFLEPLESTAVAVYLTWVRLCYDMIFNSTTPLPFAEAARTIRRMIFQVQDFILYHYKFGSKWNTPFWDYAKTLKITDPLFWEIMNYCISQKDTFFAGSNDQEHDQRTQYGVHFGLSFRNMYEGLGAGD